MLWKYFAHSVVGTLLTLVILWFFGVKIISFLYPIVSQPPSLEVVLSISFLCISPEILCVYASISMYLRKKKNTLNITIQANGVILSTLFHIFFLNVTIRVGGHSINRNLAYLFIIAALYPFGWVYYNLRGEPPTVGSGLLTVFMTA